MSEIVKQTAEDNQALMIKLKDLQRRFENYIDEFSFVFDSFVLSIV